ncbi:hypothetical protein DRN52_08775 [Thermococci archaeon]|nr:MAG: hypothetical protein DRN52_08775 [Thermococci archaeon]
MEAGKMMRIFRRKYDHSKKTLTEACNVDGTKLLRKMAKLHFEFAHKDLAGSRCIEIYEKTFSKRELAFLLYWSHVVMLEVGKNYGILTNILNRLYGGTCTVRERVGYIW